MIDLKVRTTSLPLYLKVGKHRRRVYGKVSVLGCGCIGRNEFYNYHCPVWISLAAQECGVAGARVTSAA